MLPAHMQVTNVRTCNSLSPEWLVMIFPEPRMTHAPSRASRLAWIDSTSLHLSTANIIRKYFLCNLILWIPPWNAMEEGRSHDMWLSIADRCYSSPRWLDWRWDTQIWSWKNWNLVQTMKLCATLGNYGIMRSYQYVRVWPVWSTYICRYSRKGRMDHTGRYEVMRYHQIFIHQLLGKKLLRICL